MVRVRVSPCDLARVAQHVADAVAEALEVVAVVDAPRVAVGRQQHEQPQRVDELHERRNEELPRRGPLRRLEHAPAARELLGQNVPEVEGDLGDLAVGVRRAAQHRAHHGQRLLRVAQDEVQVLLARLGEDAAERAAGVVVLLPQALLVHGHQLQHLRNDEPDELLVLLVVVREVHRVHEHVGRALEELGRRDRCEGQRHDG